MEEIDQLLEKFKAQRRERPRRLLPRNLPFGTYTIEISDVKEGDFGIETKLVRLEPKTDVWLVIPRRETIKVLEAMKQGKRRFLMNVGFRDVTMDVLE